MKELTLQCAISLEACNTSGLLEIIINRHHFKALALNDQVSIDVNLKLRSQMTFYRRNGSPNIERIN